MGWTAQFWYVLIFGCTGMALFGYDTGVVSGSLVMMDRDFQLDNFRKEFAVSATVLFAAFGSVVGSRLNDRFGRRPVIASSAILYIAGALIIAFSARYEGFISGRILLGIAIGFASGTVPLYAAELSPPTHRGMVVTLNDLNIGLGQLLAGVVNALVVNVESGWRIAMGVAAVPALMMLVGVAFLLPESPRWLAMRGRRAEAEAIVRKVCGDAALADAEIAAIEASLAAEAGTPGCGGALRRLWGEASLRRAALLGIAMMAMNQFSGINTVMYYSATVLVGVGFSATDAVWMSAACCLAQVCGVVVSVLSMDRLGRRPTALRSVVGVAITLCLLSACFAADDPTADPSGLSMQQQIAVKRYEYPWHGSRYEYPWHQPPTREHCERACHDAGWDGGTQSVDACEMACRRDKVLAARSGEHEDEQPRLLAEARARSDARDLDDGPRPMRALAVGSLMAYLIAFGSGLSGVPWVISSEIYPTDVRSTAVGQNTLANWLFNFAVAQTFLDLVDLMHAWGAFLVYAAFSIVGGVWMYFYLPETKQLSLEAIEGLFKDPYPAPMRGQQQQAAADAKVEAKPKESSSLLPK